MTARVAGFVLALWTLQGCGGLVPDHSDPSPSASVADEGVPWFREESVLRGLDFEHDSGATGRYLLPEITSGGAALFDMDQDGDLDAYLVQGGDPLKPGTAAGANRLFRNRGDGHFDDISSSSGAGDRGYGNGVTCGDYDGDGDVDLYVTNLQGDALLRNDGRGGFTNVSEQAGLTASSWTTSAAFLDYDADGDLDLFVATYLGWTLSLERVCPRTLGGPDYCNPKVYGAPLADLLYRNEGDGSFTDVSQLLGAASARGTGLGVVCADVDGDGWTDVFVANDGMPNHLWLNDGGRGFKDVAMSSGCAVDSQGQAKAGMGVALRDLDGNGTLDLLVGNLTGETDSLFRNGSWAGQPNFRDISARTGLAGKSRSLTRFGLGFHDFDLDGLLDLFEVNGRVTRPPRKPAADVYAEPNLLFRGMPGPRFEEVRPRGGTAIEHLATSRAAAFGDIDGDGRIDALVVNRDEAAHLFRNVTAGAGHWSILSVRTKSGRDALGARLGIELPGGGSRVEYVVSGGSYQASSDPRVHLGLGEVDRIAGVTVRWPGGTTERFAGFAADQVVNLQEGRGEPVQSD